MAINPFKSPSPNSADGYEISDPVTVNGKVYKKRVDILGAMGAGAGGSWGTITGDINDQYDLQAEFLSKQNKLVAGPGISINPTTNVISAEDLDPADLAGKGLKVDSDPTKLAVSVDNRSIGFNSLNEVTIMYDSDGGLEYNGTGVAICKDDTTLEILGNTLAVKVKPDGGLTSDAYGLHVDQEALVDQLAGDGLIPDPSDASRIMVSPGLGMMVSDDMVSINAGDGLVADTSDVHIDYPRVAEQLTIHSATMTCNDDAIEMLVDEDFGLELDPNLRVKVDDASTEINSSGQISVKCGDYSGLTIDGTLKVNTDDESLWVNSLGQVAVNCADGIMADSTGLSAKVDGHSIEFNGDGELQVNAANLASDGLTASGRYLKVSPKASTGAITVDYSGVAVNVDNDTVKVVANKLEAYGSNKEYVKDLQVKFVLGEPPASPDPHTIYFIPE